MSPLTIMTGKPFPDYDTLLLEFGTYVHIYEDNDPTNTTKARTTPAIALNSTGNEAGAYVFMSLVTGFPVERKQWDELIMPAHVIRAVEDMAERQEQPLLRDGRLIFEWRPGVPIDDEDEDDDEVLDVEIEGYNNHEDDDLELDEEEAQYEQNIHEEVEDIEVVPEEVDRDVGVLYDVEAHEHLIADNMHDDIEIGSEDEHVEIRSESSVDSPVDDVEHDTSDDEESVFSGRGYNLRSNRDRDYGPRINYAMDTPTSTKSYGTQLFQHDVVEMNEGGPALPVFKHLTGIIMPQMTANYGHC